MTEDAGHQEKETRKEKWVGSTSTKVHVNETDGSCTSPGEASLERGNDKCERHADLRKEKVGVKRLFLPRFRCHAHAVRCSFPLGLQMLCSSLEVLVFSEILVCAQTALVS